MASSTTKKVHIQRFDRDMLQGFVNPASFLSGHGVELLSVQGSAAVVPYEEIKAVFFVKEFEPGDASFDRRAFQARPKLDGLWVRLRFRDEDTLEGVLPNNLLQLENYGFTITPPDFSYKNRKIFVPRRALIELQVLGVVGSPLRPPRPSKPAKSQIELFEK